MTNLLRTNTVLVGEVPIREVQDFWISAAGGEVNITRFAKSGNLREIYFSPRFVIVIVIVIKCHLVPLIFSQKWHPNFGLFVYNIIINGRHTRRFLPAFALLPLCLRSVFATKVEAKCIQNGMKQPLTSPIRLWDEP